MYFNDIHIGIYLILGLLGCIVGQVFGMLNERFAEHKKIFSKETLITLGCFSECWDENNKQETIKLIKYFLKKGNQVQLSTKKYITVEEVEQFRDFINYLGQLIILVSSATISEWKKFEHRFI